MRKVLISLLLSMLSFLLSAGNPTPVRILSDTLSVSPSGFMSASLVKVEIQNTSSDFNLKDKVQMKWVACYDGDCAFDGTEYLDCPPGGKSTVSILIDLFHERGSVSMTLIFQDKTSGETLIEKTFPLPE